MDTSDHQTERKTIDQQPERNLLDELARELDWKRIACHHGYAWNYAVTAVPDQVYDEDDFYDDRWKHYRLNEGRSLAVCSNCSMKIVYRDLDDLLKTMVRRQIGDEQKIVWGLNFRPVSTEELPQCALLKPIVTCEEVFVSLYDNFDVFDVFPPELISIIYEYLDMCCSDDHAFLDCARFIVGPENKSSYYRTIRIVPSPWNQTTLNRGQLFNEDEQQSES